VTEDDRARWDERYERVGPAPLAAAGEPPPILANHEHEVPASGHALDIACGRGPVAVWLAQRGLDVWGIDISPVAIDFAQDLARRAGVADRCRFDVLDLDDGLPEGPPADVIVANRFRDRRLDGELIRRLAPGGLLAVTALSEVGAAPGRFRIPRGELPAAFAELHLIAAGEGDGEAWLLARG
jgi:SAM-dependent methyltransferase